MKGCKMANTAYDLTKKNIAKAMGVNNYSELVTADDAKTERLIKGAQEKIKFNSPSIPNMNPSGNPYIMLGRKVNSKGKYVK